MTHRSTLRPDPGGRSDRPDRRRRALRVVAGGAGAAVGVALLWVALAAILATDRGLDLTDEGLYLLSADAPSRSAAWLFPWGWHTGPLFSLVGYDIAAFRTLGAVILVLAGGCLGWVAVRAAVAFGAGRGAVVDGRPVDGQAAHSGYVLPATGSIVGALGTLLYYASLLRTPSYNWLNLAGILIAAAGLMELSRRSRASGGSMNRGSFAAAAVSALGVFLTIPAKPSSAAFLMVAGGGLLLATVGWRAALRLSGTVAALVVAWLAVALVVGAWPLDFPRVFVRAVETPTLAAEQSVVGALRDVLGTPAVIVGEFAKLRTGAVAAIGIGFAALAGAIALRAGAGSVDATGDGRRRLRVILVVFGLSAVVVAALVIVAVPFPTVGWLARSGAVVSGGAVSRTLFAPLVLAGLFLVGGAVAAGIALAGRRIASRRVLALVLFLAVLPFFFGFGSSNGIFLQAAWAAGILFVAALVPLVGAVRGPAGLDERGRRAWLVLPMLVVIATGATAWATLADSRALPYRIAPIETQTVRTVVSERGAVLDLDPDLSAVVTSLRSQAATAGLEPGTPLVGIVWRWSATVPYVLGAGVPEPLAITIFGWPGTQDMLQYNLDHGLDGFPIGDAWVLAGPTAGLGASAIGSIDAAIGSLNEATGRSFPSDYRCVMNAAGIELWRPLDRPAGSAGGAPVSSACPLPAPSSSAYDSSNGWSSR